MASTTVPAVQAAPRRPQWISGLLEDLQPTPGRLETALRVVLASVVALLLMEVLRMPFIAIGMYFIFLIGRDSPAVSLRSAFFSFAIVTLAVVTELAVVIVSDNDPVIRLLSVAVVTFIAGMIVVATNQPALGSSFGLIYCTVIALWEVHAPADRLVKTSLYLIGTFTIALVSAVTVEYVFGIKNPAERLQAQRHIRYTALEALFRLYAQNAPQAQRFEAAIRLSRIAVAGQAGMMSLYNQIVEKNLDTGKLPIAIRPRIVMLAQLMDVAAAFGTQNPVDVDADTQKRCLQIADECKRLIPGAPLTPTEGILLRQSSVYTLLDRVESALHAILTMPPDTASGHARQLVALPSNEVPLLIPGAFKKRESIVFALKISFCATFCYILYHALDWPGISTTVTTVLVTGLSSTGAIKQKLVFRVLGALIGGLILGIGASIFLFPFMDSITSLVALEAGIAFVAAWIAAGPKFNYIGLQIAFSFYIVAYEGFSSPTELAPARDRLVGILIALAVMLLVFDQIWPVRTTTVMRRTLARVLRLGVEEFETMNSAGIDGSRRPELIQHSDALREEVGRTISSLRSLNTSVPYEFGANREEHILEGDKIFRCATNASALFWNQLAVFHTESERDFLTDPNLRALRVAIANRMVALAEAIEKKGPIALGGTQSFPNQPDISNPRFAEYARNTISRFEELQNSAFLLEQHL